MTKLSKIEILLTNIGHGQNFDKHWTETGQNLDICQKIVQILSNLPFYRSTSFALLLLTRFLAFYLTHLWGNGHEKILHGEPERDEGNEVILLIGPVHCQAEHNRQEIHPELNLEIRSWFSSIHLRCRLPEVG